MIDLLIPLVAYVALAATLLAWTRLLEGAAHDTGCRLLRVGIIALITAPLYTWAALGLMNSRTFELFGPMVYRVETPRPVVALTFDDGPTEEQGARILDILKAEGVPATFFVEGMGLEQNMPIVQRMVADVLYRTRPGSIILLHVMDSRHPAAMQAAPEIIRQLRARGYSFVTVPELLALRGKGE